MVAKRTEILRVVRVERDRSLIIKRSACSTVCLFVA